jgi:hypothetical protein
VATLISRATGNFTASSTWGVTSAVANALVDSEASTRNITTSNMDSTAFALAATAVDAVAIKLSATVTPTGTLTVILRNSTTSTDVATVTINASDLHAAGNGWYVFSFANHTPNGTDSYIVRMTRSVADAAGDRISVYSNTASDTTIVRAVRLVTQAAPAATDRMIVAGEHTGAGTGNTFTVTMDNTATTSFGSTTTQALTVNKRATLAYGNVGSTAYYLKVKGIVGVYGGGTFTIGTAGTPIDASGTTASYAMDSTENCDSGLIVFNGGVFNAYGKSKATVKTLLTADVSSGTVITVASTSGWLAGDNIGIASTSQTSTQCRQRTISTVDSSTQVTMTSSLAELHSGTAPTQAEVVNLTRNVQVFGWSISLQGFIAVAPGGVFATQYVEYTQIGGSASTITVAPSQTATKKGIAVLCQASSGGSFNMQYCSLWNFAVSTSTGIYVSDNLAADAFTISHNVSYGIAANHFQLASFHVGTGWTISDHVGIKTTDNAPVFNIAGDLQGTMTDWVAVGATTNRGISVSRLRNTIPASPTPWTGTINNWTTHSNGTGGILVTPYDMVLTNLTSWRNGAGSGLFISGIRDSVIDGLTSFGNADYNLNWAGVFGLSILRNATLNGDTTFATPAGARLQGGAGGRWETVDFGTASGIKTTHSSWDIEIGASASSLGGFTPVHLTMHNCKFSSTTWLSTSFWSEAGSGSFIRSQKHQQIAGSHKTWTKWGTIEIDTGTYRTASPSELLTPSHATVKLAGGPKRAAVTNGSTLTPTVHVKKSGAYNGNAPRLLVRRNAAAGITADTVLATLTGSADGDGWWTLTGPTTPAVTDDAILEFYVDCDGTAGTLSIDDWSVA